MRDHTRQTRTDFKVLSLLCSVCNRMSNGACHQCSQPDSSLSKLETSRDKQDFTMKKEADDEQEEVMLASYWKIIIETKNSSISAVHPTVCIMLCIHLQSTCLLIGPFYMTIHRRRAQPSSEYLIINVIYFRCSISNQGVRDRLLSRSTRVKSLLKHLHTTGQPGVVWIIRPLLPRLSSVCTSLDLPNPKRTL